MAIGTAGYTAALAVQRMPYVMYQLWKLIAPLVPMAARRFAVPFVLFTTLGFVGGAAFNHYIAFPYMMAFFASFDTPDLRFMSLSTNALRSFAISASASMPSFRRAHR